MTTETQKPVSEGVTRKTILVVLSVALLINAGVLFVALPLLDGLLTLKYSVRFLDLYDLIGNNLAHGNGYRIEAGMGETLMREPGYPLFLALVFKIAGYHIEAARLANLLLAFGAGLLVMRLTEKITGDKTTALVATVLFLFYPGILIAEARAGVEISFIAVLMLFMLFLYQAVEKGYVWRYLVAGALLGAATLVRSEVLSFPLFLLIYLVLTAKVARERLQAFVRVAALSLGVVVVISPWVVRNYILTKEIVPTASVAGVAAQEGLFTCHQLLPGRDFWTVQDDAGNVRAQLASQLGVPFEGRYYYQFFYTPTDELKFNRVLLHKTEAEYARDPMLLATCGGKNFFFNFWFLGKTWKATWLNIALQLPLLVLAIGGSILLWRRCQLKNAGLVLTLILYVPAVHAPIIAHARHSMVIVPFLAILASVTLVWMWTARRAHVLRTPGEVNPMPEERLV
jgi:4-amino-4-deoxy-L-arabinose transferase-like glycosyltransferase